MDAPPRARRLALVLAAGLSLAACGGEDPLPPPSFTWVPLPGAVCSDGSGTGIGVEPGPGPSPDVLVFLNGGGACWDAITCYVLQAAEPGPYGAAELEADLRARRAGSLLDRSAPGNPYADFTFVFVPYCTGDVHAGNAVGTYVPGRSWHHSGAANLAAAFGWISSELPAPSRVVVAGSSAGGFGALFAFDLARQAWPDAKGYLVDDSGPPLAEIPQATVDAWYQAWNLGEVVTPLCGAGCQQDLSLAFGALAVKYPADRLALLSSTRDEVMRVYFGDLSTFTSMSEGVFEGGIRGLAASLEGLGTAHAFLVAGTSHTMLGSPAGFSSDGVALFEWLRRQVDDDPDWAPAIPPVAVVSVAGEVAPR